MTRLEAFEKSRKEGCRISHRYFTDDEWLVVHGAMVMIEDGVKISIDEFLRDRQGLGFDTDWYVKSKFK